MKIRWILFVMAACAVRLSGQEPANLSSPADSILTLEDAREYIREFAATGSYWREEDGRLKQMLEDLLVHTRMRYDTIVSQIEMAGLDTLSIRQLDRLTRDSLTIRWLNDSTFILDTIGWNKDLLIRDEIILEYPVDLSSLSLSDSILDENGMLDSTLFTPDTLVVEVIDTAALANLGIRMFRYVEGEIDPDPGLPGLRRSARISPDSSYLVRTDTTTVWATGPGQPFRDLENPLKIDSLSLAIRTLVRDAEERDSTLISLSDVYGSETPFWVTSGRDEVERFWVKNFNNDSITLWVGNPDNNQISLLLEEDVNFTRMSREPLHHISRRVLPPERELQKVTLVKPISVFWEKELSNSFVLSQTYLSNWTKGGENSLSALLDVTGEATYHNRTRNMEWMSSGRVKYGTLITEENGVRKNQDLLEVNSKFDMNASGKLGFSSTLFLKSQLAKGYNFPNDSVVVSKFLNPGSMTVGIGMEYEPFKGNSINAAPISYKNTFVLDTALIDQTIHGVPEDSRIRQEMGLQVVIESKVQPFNDLTLTNKLRLFSNYLNKPQNIDVDWELLAEQRISYFFTIRLNVHYIYDDDVRFPVSEGSDRKVPRSQVKQFLGLSLLLKL